MKTLPESNIKISELKRDVLTPKGISCCSVRFESLFTRPEHIQRNISHFKVEGLEHFHGLEKYMKVVLRIVDRTIFEDFLLPFVTPYSLPQPLNYNHYENLDLLLFHFQVTKFIENNAHLLTVSVIFTEVPVENP